MVGQHWLDTSAVTAGGNRQAAGGNTNRALLVGYQEDFLEIAARVVGLSVRAPFQPVAAPKAVSFYLLCPHSLVDEALLFLKEVGVAYDALRLGSHAAAAGPSEHIFPYDGAAAMRADGVGNLYGADSYCQLSGAGELGAAVPSATPNHVPRLALQVLGWDLLVDISAAWTNERGSLLALRLLTSADCAKAPTLPPAGRSMWRSEVIRLPDGPRGESAACLDSVCAALVAASLEAEMEAWVSRLDGLPAGISDVVVMDLAETAVIG
ncbi:hypothetical protein WJX81_000598 [Elliptochloris bilobata]|uniref:Mediator of RNA polymerase II transcription subunit 13 n=1 Tax=Elliptochloris bilobata TaxID=381761 RepID=A0AAW1S9V0_9CHLO